MRNGQATIEMLLGYSIALILITIGLALIFTFFPALLSGSASPATTGFTGLRITGQGYISSLGIYYIEFENLLNENINVTKISFQSGSINTTAFTCTSKFLPALGLDECNVTLTLSSPFSAYVDVFYTPSNTSTHPIIEIPGGVSG